MQRGHLPLAGDAQRDEVGARPLAAGRLGVPPPACGGEVGGQACGGSVLVVVVADGRRLCLLTNALSCFGDDVGQLQPG